jgi:ferredoxin-thioredoxin reductase catalytic subunit
VAQGALNFGPGGVRHGAESSAVSRCERTRYRVKTGLPTGINSQVLTKVLDVQKQRKISLGVARCPARGRRDREEL